MTFEFPLGRESRFPQVRSWVAALLLAGLAWPAQAQAQALSGVALPDSVKPVEEAPQAGALNPHKPYITRRVLKAGESAATLKFEVALKMRNFGELQGRVARGERVSQEEMAAKYEPLTSDYDTVAAWITTEGLTITRKDAHHTVIFARGTISQIQQALQVTFARVTLENQETTSAISAPSVPAGLRPALIGINGLQPHLRPHKHILKQQAHPDSVSGGASYLPKQIAQAYSATGLYNANILGSGQTIAIVIDTFPAASDLETFWQDAGVSQSINNVQFIQVVAGTLPAPSGEETLDVEWSSAMAPDAHVRVYAATDLANADLDAAYLRVYDDVTNNPSLGIHQMSMSYGEGETETSLSQVDTDDQYFAELAAAGVTIFASSGDDGSTPGVSRGGTPNEGGALQVEAPASDPNVTGVGGTTLVLDSNNNATSETVWNESGGGAGGGGVSEYFSRPTWQTGTGVPTGTFRTVPDVAASADPNYGAIIVLDGAQETVGGTSWSSPTWAGLCALINQARSNAGQSSLGLLGPHVYPLLGSPDYPSVYLDDFRDITSGNNATRVSGGDYSATAGYDMCTGLGAPLAQPLALMLTGSSGLVSVQNPMAVAEIAPGQNATFTVTVTGTTATYQWQRMPVGSTTWTNVSDGGAYSGSLVSTLTIADATTIMSGDQFQCMVTYGGNTVTTTPASVLVVDTPLTVATFAGKVGITGLGNGSAAEFNYPSGVAIDSSGNVYVADYGNNQIREIAPGGTVSTPYGNVNGSAGSGNGTGNSALFNGPNAIAVDGSNNIYIADTGNNLIRKISGGAVSTFAGTGGQFNSPEGVAVDGSGNVYVADTNNDVIRKITPSGGISILAGISGDAGYANGAATTVALFNGPTSVAVDSLGNVYVADFNNDVVRKISSGTVSTVAGKAGDAGYLDGLGSNALFNAPVGLGVDSSNNVYIADSLVPTIGSSAAGNCLLRKLTPTGVVSTLAGETGVAGSANGTGTSAQFYSIQAFAENSSGVVYIADTYNQTIRTGTASGIVSNSSTKIISLSGNLAFGDVTEDKTATSTLTIRNTGNATMTVTGITYPTGFSGNWASGSIASGSSQAVTVTFAPTAAATYGGNIVVNSNATSGSDFIAASGTGIAVTGTSVISLSGNLAFGNVGVGQKATSTLTISNTGNAGLTVTGIAYPAGFSGNWSSGSIPSGNSQAVTVTFAPAAAISYGGSIVVASNATTGSNSIATSGSGVIVPTEPMVETASATGVGATAATLNGEVNPEGFATSVYFQYGLTGTYGSATASMGEGVGTTNVPFAAAVSGLLPMTTYHYQAVASNTAGTVYGADEAFTTTAYSIEPVTTTGDAAAGISGAEFTALGSPAINANNYTAFQATLANGAGGVIATNNSGVWAQDSSGSRYLVARTGSVAPGTSSAVFMALSNPVYNSSEAVAFLARLKVASGEASAANADGIWSTSSGSLALVAREGGQAPGYPEGTMFKGFNSFALPDEGGVLLLATVSNGQRGIWAGNSTADLQLIVKQGDSAGGKTIANLTFLPTLPYVDGQTRSFAQGTGALVYHATFRDKTIGIVKLTGTTSQVVVLSQDAAPGVSGGRFSAFGSPALNANGDVAFEGTLVTGTEGVAASEDAGIWADDNTGTLRLVARTGGAAPGTGAKFQTLGNPVYNDNEAVAFRGTLKVVSGEAASTTAAGIWSNSGGTLALVARQGSQAPGCPAGATFKLFNALALPDQGGVIMLATLNGNSNAGVVAASNTGIWAVDSAGTLQLIVRKGDVLNGKSITGLSFLPLESHVGGQSRSFNQGTGDLTYKATFSDGTSAITTVVFP